METTSRMPPPSAPAAEVRKLVVLPWSTSLQISLKSLKVRFFRSLITVITLVLAVSFLAFTLVTTDIAQGLNSSGDPALRGALEAAGFDLPAQGGAVGSSAKERWLVILSLLVCTVGIINAQLMAVTERFREIGTMKCLGALDSFVLRLFLLEAGMQGFSGALAGALVGTLIAVLMGLIRFGWSAAAKLSGASLLGSFGMAIGVGVLLSVLGVFYPALVAARMQPVEAMRSEQ